VTVVAKVNLGSAATAAVLASIPMSASVALVPFHLCFLVM
jgi:hypothetical protein